MVKEKAHGVNWLLMEKPSQWMKKPQGLPQTHNWLAITQGSETKLPQAFESTASQNPHTAVELYMSCTPESPDSQTNMTLSGFVAKPKPISSSTR